MQSQDDMNTFLARISTAHIGRPSTRVPKAIVCEHWPMNFDSHPSRKIIAAGLDDGPIKIWSYSSSLNHSNHELMSFMQYKEKWSGMRFANSGETLFASLRNEVHVLDMNEGALTQRLIAPTGVYISCILPINCYLLATGDTEGQLVIWDFRLRYSIMSLKLCNSYISDIKIGDDRQTLLATSSRGMFSVVNIQSQEIVYKSYVAGTILKISTMRNNRNVIVSDYQGNLRSYNWGEWGHFEQFDTSIVFLGSMISISQNLLCIGSVLGKIHIVEIYPPQEIGVLVNTNFSIMHLCMSRNKKFVCFVGWKSIRFHSLSAIKNVNLND